jgi:RimJ/RimL family protein N-acetyltransferase
MAIEASTGIWDITYCANSSKWGFGLATEAIDALLRFGFSVLNATQIIARCIEDNIAARKAAQKCSMVRHKMTLPDIWIIGHKGKQVNYSISREQWQIIMDKGQISDRVVINKGLLADRHTIASSVWRSI